MSSLIAQLWWIMPVSGLLFAAFFSWLRFKKQKAILDIIHTYAQRGEQPPEALLAQLDMHEKRPGSDQPSGTLQSPAHYWSLFGLFLAMALGFGIAAAMGIDGKSGAFVMVSLVMAAVALWSVINALFLAKRRV